MLTPSVNCEIARADQLLQAYMSAARTEKSLSFPGLLEKTQMLCHKVHPKLNREGKWLASLSFYGLWLKQCAELRVTTSEHASICHSMRQHTSQGSCCMMQGAAHR